MFSTALSLLSPVGFSDGRALRGRRVATPAEACGAPRLGHRQCRDQRSCMGVVIDWDVVVVGAGPAGAAAALGALSVDPTLRVGLLDRAEFPRDKACGDGIAPQVLDLLDDVGVDRLVDDWAPVRRLRLRRQGVGVDAAMRRSCWVVPRRVFDERIVRAAERAGATLVRHRARSVDVSGPGVVLDDRLSAQVVVGADGAHSVVRRALGLRPGPHAVALRGYAPTPAHRAGAQVIEFGTGRGPAYAWSFDRGDGWSNVGYGELLSERRGTPTRAHLTAQLERLLPGATGGGSDWRGHQLPLSTGPFRPPDGRGLLAGDAAGLVNPMTGEGIYYAVATGLAAGRAAAEALGAGDPLSAGARQGARVRPLLERHLRHVAVAARLAQHGAVLDAGIRAAAAHQAVFEDLVELGLGGGRLTPALLRGLGGSLLAGLVPGSRFHHPPRGTAVGTPTVAHQERDACEY